MFDRKINLLQKNKKIMTPEVPICECRQKNIKILPSGPNVLICRC